MHGQQNVKIYSIFFEFSFFMLAFLKTAIRVIITFCAYISEYDTCLSKT